MSSRERLRAAFDGKPTDRIPWSPCVDGYFLSSLRGGEELDETGLHQAIGADALLRHVMVFTSTHPMLGLLNRPAENPRIELRIEPTSTGSYRVSYETAVGTLTEEVLFNPESMNIPWFVRRKLRTIEDVKIYMHALETLDASRISARSPARCGASGKAAWSPPPVQPAPWSTSSTSRWEWRR